MKRRRVHIAFGIVAAGFAAASIQLALRLHAADRSNALIASAVSATAAAGKVQASNKGKPAADATAPNLKAVDIDTPEAALTRAIALAQTEDYDRALRAFEPLTQSSREDIRRIALYDLGNLHMRQSARVVDFEVAKARTLVELAKQSYRRVLDETPMHWPSRYNLERALWLESESDDTAIETTPPPAVDRPNGDKPELP